MTPTPDPETTISEAQAIQKTFSEFYAVAASHDAHRAATHMPNVPDTLQQVARLQAWLRRFADTLRQRR